MGKHDRTGTFIDGTLVAKLRKSKGLSQEELAEKANLSERSIAKYEKKKAAGIQPKSAKQLADALGEPLDKLLVTKIDGLEVEPSVVTVEEEINNADAQGSVEVLPPLHLSSHADPILKIACKSLLSTNVSDDCVSSAIAAISGYLYHVVAKIPELKEHSHLIVTNSISALSSAALEESCAANTEMWSCFKSCMSELANAPQLPDYAKKEALDAIGMITHSRMTDDMELKFKAVRSCLFWLSDNWQYIHQNSYAYSVFRYVSSMLTAAPTDHQTREKIVTGVNAFVAFIRIFDISGIYYQEGDTNE